MNPLLIGGALGALGGFLGGNKNPTTSSTSQGSSAASSQGQSSFTPHSSALPFYGYGAAAGNALLG